MKPFHQLPAFIVAIAIFGSGCGGDSHDKVAQSTSGSLTNGGQTQESCNAKVEGGESNCKEIVKPQGPDYGVTDPSKLSGSQEYTAEQLEQLEKQREEDRKLLLPKFDACAVHPSPDACAADTKCQSVNAIARYLYDGKSCQPTKALSFVCVPAGIAAENVITTAYRDLSNGSIEVLQLPSDYSPLATGWKFCAGKHHAACDCN